MTLCPCITGCDRCEPPPTDPAPDRARLRASLLAFVATAPIGEVKLLDELRARIEQGRRVYGEWVAANESRDLVREQQEELLDGLVYGAMLSLVERGSR